MNITKGHCQDCFFWYRENSDISEGDCKANPPTATLLPTPGTLGGMELRQIQTLPKTPRMSTCRFFTSKVI